MQSLLEFDKNELAAVVKEFNQPAFRAKQLREWMVAKYCYNIAEMTNLPLSFREQLAAHYLTYPLTISTVQHAKDSETIKFTAKTLDEEMIEVVLLKYHYGYSVCLSTQIGCAMGCSFCASTQGGLVRNCTTTEILAQLLLAEHLAKERIGHIVLMGMGEPLHNYDAVVGFLTLCRDQNWGPGISLRHVTVSTCGLVPQIKKLAHENLPVTLALSLHAPNDRIRQMILPIARKYALEDVISACREYFKHTDRRISCEYTLIKGINDSPACAKELAQLLKNEHMHVNLIPYNAVDFLPWESPAMADIERFANVLRKADLPVTVRRSLGDDIDAACGQLRRRELKAGCEEHGFANSSGH